MAMVAMMLAPAHAGAQDDWQLRKDKNGIRVYTRETDQSGFDEFRAETVLDFSPQVLLNVLKDVEQYDQWVSEVKTAEVLEKSGDTSMVYYSVIEVPFPFQDRDVVYHNTFSWDSSRTRLTITTKGLPEYLDKKENLVRMPVGKGRWIAETLEPGMTKVTLQMLIDPGGNLPAWLVNSFIADSPYRTMKNLKTFGKKEEYQTGKLREK